MKYFYNLKWYRQAPKSRFYKSTNRLTPGLFVIVRFNWLRGLVVMRYVSPGGIVLHLGNAGDFVALAPEEVFPAIEEGQLQLNF